MEIGKVPNEVLEELVISQLSHRRPEVVQGSGVGEDCAVVDFGDALCVVSTDPITGATSDIGRLIVNVASNDIASAGAEPVAMTLTVLAPPTSTEEELREVVRQANEAARSIDVQIVGGHTEVTDVVTRMLVSATVLGRQARDRVVYTGGAAVGDALVMTKHAGIEGASILAMDRTDELARVLGQEGLETARTYADDLSVVSEGRIGGQVGVSGMHDATEGGVLGATWEMADACGHGIEVELAAIPVSDVTKAVCAHFEIDPYRLVSSGVMLITVASDRLGTLLTRLAEEGVPAAQIGWVVDGPSRVLTAAGPQPLEPPEADELYRVGA